MTQELMLNGYMVETDGRKIWVTAPTGETVARFCRNTTEIQATLEQHEKTGQTVLYYDIGPYETHQIWHMAFLVFNYYLNEHYPVPIPDSFFPRWFPYPESERPRPHDSELRENDFCSFTEIEWRTKKEKKVFGFALLVEEHVVTVEHIDGVITLERSLLKKEQVSW